MKRGIKRNIVQSGQSIITNTRPLATAKSIFPVTLSKISANNVAKITPIINPLIPSFIGIPTSSIFSPP